MHFLMITLIGVTAGLVFPALASNQLPQPTGQIILSVTGRIASTNTAEGAAFDRAMLESLDLHRVATRTTWTDGVKLFEGVLARDLLAQVGADGESVTATALNDYAVSIPIADFYTYDVLLAIRMDGEELLPRDKGPIWIVYPRDQHAELQDARYDHRWIWQLKHLHVE